MICARVTSRHIHISLLLDYRVGVGVFYPLGDALRPCSTASRHVCRARLASSGDHRTARIEHLELATVVVTQLVTVLFLPQRIRFRRVGSAAWTFILHCTQHCLVHEDFL